MAALMAAFTLAAAGAAHAQERLGVVVDLSKRQLDVRVGGEVVGTYDVAVGQPGHRTPEGVYGLSRVVWNPDWVPPESAWAEDAEKVGPGEAGNPMGDVKIYFSDLLYIHGTDDRESLGEPASHGCIRMANEDALDLARKVMEHGGAARPDSWYARARRNDGDQHTVEIPDPPTLRVTP